MEQTALSTEPGRKLGMEDLQSLLEQAQGGNLNAYGLIVQRFQGMAIGYAYSILGDYHLAEDAAQEAFLDAYPSLSKVYGPAAFPSWLRRIVFKHCDRLTRRRQPVTVELNAAAEVASNCRPLPDILADQEMAFTVHAAIETLPEHERTVTLLYYLANHSQKEIADFLDVRVSTVKNRLFSARNRLHTWFLDTVEDTLPNQIPVNGKDFSMSVIDIIKAAEEGDLSQLSALLERHPHLAKAKDERPGATALHYACWSGQQAAVDLLLQYGADLNLADDSYDSTPIGWARENGQFAMIDYLVSRGAKMKLRQAVNTGKLELVKEYVAADPSILNSKTESMLPIHDAVLWGQKEMVTFLLANGAQVNLVDDFNRTALDIALLHPLPIHGDGYAAIEEGNHAEIAHILVEYGAQMKLWHAAAMGKIDEVRRLAQASPHSINEKSFDVTPLYAAAQFGHDAVVANLLENGADVVANKANGTTPLHAATWSGSVAVTQLLLDAGIDVNVKSDNGVTPLHQAVWRRHSSLVRMLIEAGADTNATDSSDHTPLVLARTSESIDGWHPADWGPARASDPDIVRLLQAA